MKRPTVWISAFLLACALGGTRALAILGVGDIVFDPSVYAQAVQQVIQLEQQYAQLVRTYQTVRGQYEQLLWMAKQVPVTMSVRYRSPAIRWRASSATNLFGTTAGWVNAINTGSGVADGYAGATERLDAYGSAWGNVPADHAARIKTSYGTVELADGAALAEIRTIGRLRAGASSRETAIQGLEDDSLSADPRMNTEIAVLNKINAANLIAVRSAQDANQLLVALAESQAVEAKRARDAEARAINQHIRFMAEGRRVLTAQAARASDAMRAWRMP
jgi:hypothetical protein